MNQATAHLSPSAWCYLMHIRSESKPVRWLLLLLLLLLLPLPAPPLPAQTCHNTNTPTHICSLHASQTEWHPQRRARFHCWA